MISFLIYMSLQAAFAGQEAGSGGDTVECVQTQENSFNGIYALDYLLTYKESNENGDVVPVKSLNESIQRIKKSLDEKMPELSESFNEFTKLLRNEDVSLPRFWEEAPFGLVNIKDENIINLVPMNCRQNGEVKIVQAIIRMNPATTGTEKYRLIYKYVPSLFEQLNTNDPLQLSFLLVHEWLWDLSHNVEKNRRLNRMIHSAEFETLNRDSLRTKLTTLGLQIPAKIGPKQASFDSCPADVESARALMNRASQAGTVLATKSFSFFRRYQRCPFDGVNGCLISTSQYLDIPSPSDIKGFIDENGQKYLYFRSQLSGSFRCNVDTENATFRCVKPNQSSGTLDWWNPSGTVGKGCIRFYDSNFYPGAIIKDAPVDGNLDEIVLSVEL